MIVFAQSRLTTEILTTYLKDDFGGQPGTTEQIRGYRGGYLPQRRREIEKGLREGTVRAVVSTNALELGIDIGALDVCIMAGYPGTIAATWQRAGRAGRRSSRSAAVLVASSAPLDQFVVRNPSYFFDAPPEHALINPDNLHILVDHVKCAAFELPFTTSEEYGKHNVQDVLAVLAESGFVHRSAADSPKGGESEQEGAWQWTNESYPADAVSLRSISSDNFVVVDTTNGADVIGETSFTSGPPTLHEKAIYIIEGALYQVDKLDFDGRKAYVRQIDCDYYTDAITHTKVTVLETFATGFGTRDSGFEKPAPTNPESRIPNPERSHGEVHVSSRVVGFKKIKFYTNENVGSGELDLPEQQMHTTAYWLTVPKAVMAALPFAPDDRRDGVVGLSFAMRQVAQLLLMCDRQDIGISIGSGEPFADAQSQQGEETLTRTGIPTKLAEEPRIFIYDNYPGGIGFSEPLFQMHDSLLARTRQLIAACDCQHGCPTCVGPVGNTGPLAKMVALRILDLLVDGAAALPVSA
jgi:DEAD/DEAH box helicase domain-containing protein